jgi:pimeloyl-ACP methyl ester carboxylesterase
MIDNTKVKSFKQKVNDIDFYCELRGSGPSVVLVPSGEGDCGSFAQVADALANEFTVFTLDMRGCSRSGWPPTRKPFTSQDLASDVAGLIKSLGLAPATIYGCSSGGQTVLSIGVYFPEIVRNLMVHEAALHNDSPSSEATLQIMKEQIDQLVKKTGSKNAAVGMFVKAAVANDEAWENLGSEYHKRVSKNGAVWLDYYVGTADQRSYTVEELSNMPPLVFSVGLLSQAWCVEANLITARRGNAEVVWLPSGHFPQVSIPELLTNHIRKHAKKYLK